MLVPPCSAPILSAPFFFLEMSESLKPCPHLPQAFPDMDWRCLNAFGSIRDIEFYLTALRYAQYLWLKGYPGRAILAMTRGLYADLDGSESQLGQWPLPFRALQWFLLNYREEYGFLGNPRISYQHQAGRIRGERRCQISWRAWACWYIVKQARPDLEPDRKHRIEEPEKCEIAAGLKTHGILDELQTWQVVVDYKLPQAVIER